MAQYTNYILVCGGTGCRASQSEQIIENLRAAVEQYGLEDTQVIRTGCFGFCEKGPVVKMIPDNTFTYKFNHRMRTRSYGSIW